MINPTAIPFLMNAGNRDRARVAPGMLMHFLATSADTNGAFAMLEARGRQGMEPRAHMLLTMPSLWRSAIGPGYRVQSCTESGTGCTRSSASQIPRIRCIIPGG